MLLFLFSRFHNDINQANSDSQRAELCVLILHFHAFVRSYGEELSRCQEEVRRLHGSLAAARDDCVGVSDERLQLQQENLRLRKEMDELRKATLLLQKKAKQQVLLVSCPAAQAAATGRRLKSLVLEECHLLSFRKGFQCAL